MPDTHIGVARSRVDGPKKVSGTATYAGEFGAEGLLHGCVLNSTIAQGRITRIDASAAEAMPGVVRVITHENRPRTAWRGSAYHDDVAPPGTPFRALYDDHVAYSGQPVALVVAESFEIARDAATLVRIEYEEGQHSTDLALLRDSAKPPSKQRSGIPPPPKPRGHPAQALDGIPVLIDREYHMAAEHHNPMEPHASTVIVQADGSLLVHDKVQGVQNSLKYLQAVFGRKDIRVVTPFVGGAFGSGLRPQYQLFLAVLAADDAESVGAGGADARPNVHLHPPAGNLSAGPVGRHARRHVPGPAPRGGGGDVALRGIPGGRRQLVGPAVQHRARGFRL